MANYRPGRINEELKREISDIIRNNIKDPRMSGLISVTRVEATRDLSYAKVFISIFGTDDSKDETLGILKKSSSFIRKEVGSRMKLRHTPQIIVQLDESIENGMHIDSLIQKIKEKENRNE